jgi:hypothetical protein
LGTAQAQLDRSGGSSSQVAAGLLVAASQVAGRSGAPRRRSQVAAVQAAGVARAGSRGCGLAGGRRLGVAVGRWAGMWPAAAGDWLLGGCAPARGCGACAGMRARPRGDVRGALLPCCAGDWGPAWLA